MPRLRTGTDSPLSSLNLYPASGRIVKEKIGSALGQPGNLVVWLLQVAQLPNCQVALGSQVSSLRRSPVPLLPFTSSRFTPHSPFPRFSVSPLPGSSRLSSLRHSAIRTPNSAFDLASSPVGHVGLDTSARLTYKGIVINAGVVKLVDARDSKSRGA